MKINSFNTWILAGYSCAILVFTWYSPKEITTLTFIGEYDKFIHFIEYSILGYLIINALNTSIFKSNTLIFAMVYVIFIAGCDEILQHFIPGRIPDIWDGIADLAGGLTGAVIKYKIG